MIAWLAFALADVGDYEWRLAGIYDGVAIDALREHEPSFVWRAHEGMTESCGPPKSPDGMGVFEAEALANHLMPALFVVLERNGGAPLGPDNLRVALGDDGPQVLLQPMVVPRHIEFTVDAASGAERVAQLVRTQLETEACMEHKTGRAWLSHEAGRVRQAFLLDPPAGMDASRKFFGGQQDPVPALIGPPDACMRGGDPGLRGNASGRGDGSLTLVPTDVWGASVRSCAVNEVAGMALAERSRTMPLRHSGETGPYQEPERLWSGLEVDIRPGSGGADEDARVDLIWREGKAAQPVALMKDAPLFSATESGPPGLVDLLAQVPYRYPVLAGPEGPRQYTVLVIPNWQLVEATRRLDAEAPDTPMRTTVVGIGDGIAHVLEHPERLYIQLQPETEGAEWPNLAGHLEGALLREPWGYTVGALRGRAHIATIGREIPSWEQSLAAQRGGVFAALLAGAFILLGVGVLGLRRLVDLVNPVPEERASYWPGLENTVLADTPQNMPEDEEGEGE